jgi:hypothetical protein
MSALACNYSFSSGSAGLAASAEIGAVALSGAEDSARPQRLADSGDE